VNVLIWHVHGSWTTSFVQGRHTYLLPTVAERGSDGRGRARTWDWPAAAVEVTPEELADTAVDVVVVQRPRDLELAEQWLGRRPGRDVPLIWLEHNAPQGEINRMCHPARDRADCTVVHVTHTNDLFWDTGTTRTRVIEHGVVDPGHLATAELASAAVVVNEPLRRGRVVGTDLLGGVADHVAVDLFGMGVADVPTSLGPRRHPLHAHEDLPQAQLHLELARRRAYLHLCRWTSLGLALIEAMHLGLPVVALSTTETPAAVPCGAGVVSNDVTALHSALRRYMDDPDLALGHGARARSAARERYGLERFLDDWDRLLEDL
jgi:hypothetical protein